jgi:hypothetical protein
VIAPHGQTLRVGQRCLELACQLVHSHDFASILIAVQRFA